MPRLWRHSGPTLGDRVVVYVPLPDLGTSLLIGEGTYQDEPSGPGTGVKILLNSGVEILFDRKADPFAWILTRDAGALGSLVVSSLSTHRADYHRLAGVDDLMPLKDSLRALPPMPSPWGRRWNYVPVQDVFENLERGDWVVLPQDLEGLRSNLQDRLDPARPVVVADSSLVEHWYLVSRIVRTVAQRQPYLLPEAASVLQLTMQVWSNSNDAAAFVATYVENPWLMPVWSALPARFLTEVVLSAHTRLDWEAHDLLASRARWQGDTTELERLAAWPVTAPAFPLGPLFQVELWVDGKDQDEGFGTADHLKASTVVASETDADDLEAYVRALVSAKPRRHRERKPVAFFTKQSQVDPKVYPSTLETAKEQLEHAVTAWGGLA